MVNSFRWAKSKGVLAMNDESPTTTIEADKHSDITALALRILQRRQVRRVLDVGCGRLRTWLQSNLFHTVTGIHFADNTLETAAAAAQYHQISTATQLRILHGSLVYVDKRWQDHDAVICADLWETLTARQRQHLLKLILAAKPRLVLWLVSAAYATLLQRWAEAAMAQTWTTDYWGGGALAVFEAQ
jgi:2-polyprenyl-3-methyl-5-hydroxy-6-metoxy-1,4-benzoquinol methylase